MRLSGLGAASVLIIGGLILCGVYAASLGAVSESTWPVRVGAELKFRYLGETGTDACTVLEVHDLFVRCQEHPTRWMNLSIAWALEPKK